jgi:polar amino acid transport system permease protein
MASDRFMPIEGLLTTAVCYLIFYFGLKLAAAIWSHFNLAFATHH